VTDTELDTAAGLVDDVALAQLTAKMTAKESSAVPVKLFSILLLLILDFGALK
jgi:hypothetical protein